MISADRVHFLLYGVGCLWSLLVWTVAAGLVGKWNSTVSCASALAGSGQWPKLTTDGYRYAHFDSANAVLAWGLLSWMYYTAA